MAKSKKRRSTRHKKARVAKVNAKTLRPSTPIPPILKQDLLDLRKLSEIEDRRVNYFSKPRPTLSIQGDTKVKAAKSRLETSPFLGFQNADKVIVCVRRKTRRQVLFAKNKAGSGKRQKSPRYNSNSNIRC